MKKKVFAVCDLESGYAYRLMDYIYEKEAGTFEVQAFTNVKNLSAFAREQEIELLLISSSAMCEAVKELPIRRIVILSEGEILQELSNYPCVYKYQASDSLVSEVMTYYADAEPSEPAVLLKKKVEIIGIYSPVRRTLRTSFALTLGQLLGKERNVLYLNFEEYAGFASMLGKEYKADLTDLILFFKGGKWTDDLQTWNDYPESLWNRLCAASYESRGFKRSQIRRMAADAGISGNLQRV